MLGSCLELVGWKQGATAKGRGYHIFEVICENRLWRLVLVWFAMPRCCGEERKTKAGVVNADQIVDIFQ